MAIHCRRTPARNEADVIGASVSSLLRQDYPGPLTFVVDDDSSDDTAAVVGQTAVDAGRDVTVVTSKGPPAAGPASCGRSSRESRPPRAARPDYLLLTDADIVHAPIRWPG